VLQVNSAWVNGGIPEIRGLPGDPISSGMAMRLDYGIYYTWLHDVYGFSPDLGDLMELSTNATAFLTSDGYAAGMSSPRAGLPSAGGWCFSPSRWKSCRRRAQPQHARGARGSNP